MEDAAVLLPLVSILHYLMEYLVLLLCECPVHKLEEGPPLGADQLYDLALPAKLEQCSLLLLL